MSAAKYNFTIDQGADLTIPIAYDNSDGTPIVLTGYIARMDIRSYVDDTSTLDELTTENSRISIESYSVEAVTHYRVDVIFTSAITKAYTFDTAVYDLEIEDTSGIVTRLIYGTINLSKEVTRSEDD